MRSILIAAASACLFAAGAIAPAFAASGAQSEQDQRQDAIQKLAAKLSASLRPDQCLSKEDALKAIQNTTSGWGIDVVAAALRIVKDERPWCPGVQDALATADQAVILALAAGTGSTGSVGGPSGPPSVPFASGGFGAPGGGGGSGYTH